MRFNEAFNIIEQVCAVITDDCIDDLCKGYGRENSDVYWLNKYGINFTKEACLRDLVGVHEGMTQSQLNGFLIWHCAWLVHHKKLERCFQLILEGAI